VQAMIVSTGLYIRDPLSDLAGVLIGFELMPHPDTLKPGGTLFYRVLIETPDDYHGVGQVMLLQPDRCQVGDEPDPHFHAGQYVWTEDGPACIVEPITIPIAGLADKRYCTGYVVSYHPGRPSKRLYKDRVFHILPACPLGTFGYRTPPGYKLDSALQELTHAHA
jgi:hypothetical protein